MITEMICVLTITCFIVSVVLLAITGAYVVIRGAINLYKLLRQKGSPWLGGSRAPW